jgi:hypothetical protein
MLNYTHLEWGKSGEIPGLCRSCNQVKSYNFWLCKSECQLQGCLPDTVLICSLRRTGKELQACHYRVILLVVLVFFMERPRGTVYYLASAYLEEYSLASSVV